MKRFVPFLVAAAAAFALASCGSIPVPGVSIGLDAPSLVSGSGSSSGISGGPADFKADEVLAAHNYTGDDPTDASFYVGRVLTPASDKTKNQAEVLWVEDGSKGWTGFVIPSRKAEKADFQIGTMVFYLSGWEDHDKIDQESYRKSQWRLGRVTNNDELFKNRVEVDGGKFHPTFIRVPTVAVD